MTTHVFAVDLVTSRICLDHILVVIGAKDNLTNPIAYTDSSY